ncbi:unnamed protein product [Linum tenue]|uniref:Methyl-CpG-binding domain-containing protein 9 n=1 Tax=Linum tenue TaxID=586396 RepID=A0AAV0NCC5_9ROSI|nr:unnamed protein product [Linum tenue]
MELNDSTAIAATAATLRSPLPIDLNEIPTSSSSSPPLPLGLEAEQSEPYDDLVAPVDLVRSFHDHPDPAPGLVAGLPREGACGTCGGPEAQGHVVVCDGCERGFHLACLEMRGGGGLDAAGSSEWLCAECLGGGVKSKGWPLGFKNNKRMILDINASPPRDADGDGEPAEDERLLHLRKCTPGDNSSDGNAFGAPVTYSNLIYAGNGFGLRKGSGRMMHAFRMGFRDILHHDADRGLEEVNWGFPIGKCRSGDNTSIRLPSRNPNELFLQGLREFVSERHGVLAEGWRAELKHSTSSYELYVVYCSPDGETFGTMSEVAVHLGLNPVSHAMDIDRSDGSCSQLPEKPHAYKRRKYKKSKEVLENGYHKHFLSNIVSGGISDGKLGKDREVKTDDNGTGGAEPSSDGFPVQFEDLFVISLGKIDARPLYHDVGHIWPVGYRSCWHDKVTGSMFVQEVEDGGDLGPVFRIKRFSCSVYRIPEVSTVLVIDEFAVQNNEESCSEICDGDPENGESVDMLLMEHSPPSEDDIVNCLKCVSNECITKTSESLQNSAVSGLCGVLSSDKLDGDYIGEILVEEQSPSLAWRKLAQKLVDAYSEIFKREGKVRLSCCHADIVAGEPIWTRRDGKLGTNFAMLTKFCSSPNYLGIPLVYEGEVGLLAASLSKWLDEDRFGLDVDFVQEMLEELPGVEICFRYESLNHRRKHTRTLTLENGLVTAKRKSGVQLDDLFRRSKKARLIEDSVMDYPPGRLLCPKLPSSVLVGDLYQVWELLCRFHDILDLKDPLTLGELEEEIINPWSGCSIDGCTLTKNVSGSHAPDILGLDKMDSLLQSSRVENTAVHEDDPHAFIPVEAEIATDAAQTELASVNPFGCMGASLTRAHSALLAVLIYELQSRVAALVDPTLDSGDVKSKRGKRRDSDNAISARRSKLSMLPINELTWPELSRRFVLAVLSMDGNLESAEITARESGKVFRCLQGDGGVLCGALTGVAGMESDAHLLAEARKKIYGSLSCDMDVITIEGEVADASGTSEKSDPCDVTMPEWAQVLEPVRKLPTNVGTRIRKCVYDALEKCPPDWAKTRLEHSISKEVYKGNASGPTKKAVLAVLADVQNEIAMQNSEKRNKRKMAIAISDVIMKQCRIVLRRTAADDDGKVFCTLLGRNLLNSNDNDDEGLLGSPAMVSRPLDFRTIDLRLALGAYGTCHESFLEDVRELWDNVQAVFHDQSDLCELAQTLSCNFESLYEKEVVNLVEKLEAYAKMDHLSEETKKDLEDVLASVKDIPKAPWDEGVCKVCGVDKDDDSVLLCDTCDAEYHTYCLSPPLARIPEGNWYCPSCVSGVCGIQQASQTSHVAGRSLRKKYQGEVTSAYLEKLGRLSVVLGGKEYWEFTVDERIFLLKFLCDELLGTALIRQHLEQCMETSAELQQKLRSFVAEWKNLKSKEEFMALRAVKKDSCFIGERYVKEGVTSALMTSCSHVVQPVSSSDPPTLCSPLSNEVLTMKGCGERTGINGCSESSMDSRIFHGGNEQAVCSQGKEQQVLMDGKNRSYQENGNFSARDQSPSENHLAQVGDAIIKSESSNSHGHLTTDNMNEPQNYDTELSSLKNDILMLKNSIMSIELQLFRLSTRREYLGSDSLGRLYWASAVPGKNPCVVVDGTLTLQQREISGYRDPVSSKLGTINSRLPSGRLKDNAEVHPYWIAYESDSEIKELICCLDNDLKQRELKESLLQLLKLRSLENRQICYSVEAEHQPAPPVDLNKEKDLSRDCVTTKAAMFMEKKYGKFAQLESGHVSNKLLEKKRMTDGDKMYRCECLEPVWQSRLHCFTCHRTFIDDAELKGHGDGTCCQTQKCEESNHSIKLMGEMASEAVNNNCTGKIAESSKSRSDPRSRLDKFQSEVIPCPYNFEDISSRFVTKDSLMELVQSIGLLSSNGVPSFVTSVSPCVSDSTVLLISAMKDGGGGGKSNLDRSQVDQPVSDKVSGKSVADETNELARTKKSFPGGPERRDLKSHFDRRSSETRHLNHCIIPSSAQRPLLDKISAPIMRQLKINLLDMEAALPGEALRASKSGIERSWAWRAFVKSSNSIYEMIQATVVLEDMIKRDYLRNEWWYWSSLSAAAKTSTISSLALRIFSLDSAIFYEKVLSNSDSPEKLKPISISEEKTAHLDSPDKSKTGRKSNNKKRKEPEG